MLELRTVVLDELHVKGINFEVKVKSPLGLKGEDGSLVGNTSELPVSVGVVSAARLEHSDRSELLRLEGHGSFLRLVNGITNDVISVPFTGFLIPNSNFNHGRILGHEEVVRHFNSDFNRVVHHGHSGVREGNNLQAFFNREDTTHGPLELSLGYFRISEHTEVNDTSNNEVGRFLSASQVVEAGPERAYNNLHGSVFLRKRGLEDLLFLRSAGVKLEADSFVTHVLRGHVSPDTKDKILTVEDHLNKVFLRDVSLASFSLILFGSDLSDFFSSSL